MTGVAARRLAITIALAAAVVVGFAASRAEAQEPPGRTPLRLVGQTPWVADDQPFTIAMSARQGLPAGGTIELTLYGALTSRDPLVRGDRDPTLLGPVRDTLSIPVELAPAGRENTFRLTLQTDGSGSGLPVAPPGVYPLEIALAGPDGVPWPSMLTFVTRYDPEALDSRLRAAVVLPLHAPPAFGPDGSAVLSDRARRLFDVRSGLLERHEDVPLSVVPTPETLEALADADPDLLAEVREALEGRSIIAGPYVRLDLAAFASASDLAGPLQDQFDTGARTLRRLLQLPMDRRTWAAPDNPTTAALDALAGVGIDRGMFREESVTGGTTPISEPVVVSGATGQRFDAVLADSVLRAHVNGTADPVLMAHRALADLALLASPPDQGGVATDGGDAGVAIELPANRPLPANYLDTLLRGLGQPGPVRPVSLTGLLDADPPGEAGPEPGPTVEGVPLAGQDLTTYGRNLASARSLLTGYTRFAGRTSPVAAELRRRLLISGSIDLTENQRGGYLQSVSSVIHNRTAAVDIVDDGTVTLTSREGDIPLTIRNDTGGPVEVELSFDSNNRLDFPEGARQQVRLDEGPNRIEIRVVARSSGSFPLRITATSPDGVLVVSRAQVTVRSTFVSGVGVVLSVGALLFLVIWWALHFRSTRRNRRLVDPEDLPVNTDPDQATDEPADATTTSGNALEPPPV